MSTAIRNHATTLPNGIRDPYNLLGANSGRATNATAKAEALRAKAVALGKKLSDVKRTFRRAVAQNDGSCDLNTMGQSVHRLANELSTAEEELKEAQALADAWEAERSRVRFDAIAKELAAVLEDFKQKYLAAALALAEFYALGDEARELATHLCDKIANGARYYNPDIKALLGQADLDPNPLPALKDAGYGETSNFLSFRRHCPLVPLKKEK